MATTYQNSSRPIGRPAVQKSRTKKTTSHQSSSTITNNSKDIEIRFGNKSSKNSMYQPSSILKKKPLEQPYANNFNNNIVDWHPPSDLETIKSRPYYSPIHTPPRLRTLVTPSGIEPYRNQYNLRRLNSPLPGLRGRYSPPVLVDTWGLDPTDYTNVNLIRPYPSPLSHYGLPSAAQKQKKSYIVVPDLTNFVSPPVSRGGANFILPSHPMSPVYVPDSQYTHLELMHSFTSPRFHRESSDYVYIRQNEAFANRYIGDFIDQYIEDQFIPDILLEILGELDQENKKRGGKSNKTELDRYYAELNQRLNHDGTNNTALFSDNWMRELDSQRPPSPASNVDSNKSSLKPMHFKRYLPTETANRVRYHDLPADVQGRLLANINQELIDFEIKNMVTELGGQTLADGTRSVPGTRDTKRYIRIPPKNEVYEIQYNSIEKYAKTKLLDTIYLDQLILKYIRQNGSVVDVDDLSRLLDANILGNLIHQYQHIDGNRSQTVDNYGSRKFHLNTFMNITMDLLLTELSASLIEDMKDLDEQERKISSEIF